MHTALGLLRPTDHRFDGEVSVPHVVHVPVGKVLQFWVGGSEGAQWRLMCCAGGWHGVTHLRQTLRCGGAVKRTTERNGATVPTCVEHKVGDFRGQASGGAAVQLVAGLYRSRKGERDGLCVKQGASPRGNQLGIKQGMATLHGIQHPPHAPCIALTPLTANHLRQLSSQLEVRHVQACHAGSHRRSRRSGVEGLRLPRPPRGPLALLLLALLLLVLLLLLLLLLLLRGLILHRSASRRCVGLGTARGRRRLLGAHVVQVPKRQQACSSMEVWAQPPRFVGAGGQAALERATCWCLPPGGRFSLDGPRCCRCAPPAANAGQRQPWARPAAATHGTAAYLAGSTPSGPSCRWSGPRAAARLCTTARGGRRGRCAWAA